MHIICDTRAMQALCQADCEERREAGVLSGQLRGTFGNRLAESCWCARGEVAGTMIFVYWTPSGVMLSDKTLRELQRQHPKLELVRQFRTIQDARRYCQKMRFQVVSDEQPEWTGITPEGRERMREKKRGANNPNHGGLSPEHKANISRNKRMAYRGEFNPMWNRRHKSSTRLLIGMANIRRRGRRWAVDEQGREHFIAYSTLPPGWTWGRARGTGARL